MRQFERSLGEWVIRYRWWIILVSLLTFIGAGSGIQFLTFNRDLRVFFSEENPQLQALEDLENTYTKSDNVLLVLAPKNGHVFTRETLAAVEDLTERLWHMPYSGRVDSLTNYQHIRVEGDDLFVEDLVKDAERVSDADLERIRAIALSEPTLVNRLISPSGHVTGLAVTILLPGKSIAEVTEVADFARAIADGFRKEHPDISIYLTGMVMFDDAYGEVSQDDLSTLVPAMFVVLMSITALSLPSITGTLATLLIIVMSTVTGMGLAGWLGISLNPASVSAPTIILTVALADSIHILVTMLKQMQMRKSKRQALVESLRLNLRAMVITSVTTAIGFLTMNFSDAPPFRDLGNIVAMGVVAALGYSVFLLPAVMAILPVRLSGRAEVGALPCDRLADFVIRRRTVVFWGTLAVAILLAGGTLRIELNDEWVKYFDERYDIRIATDFMSESIAGFDIIEYSLESGTSGGIHDPAYLAKVDDFANWYRRQPGVVHVNTLVPTMKRLNRSMHGGSEAYYRIPERRELAAQFLLLYELSLPFGLDLNNQVNFDKSASRMTVLLRNTSTRALRELEENARDWLRDNAPESMFAYGSGLAMVWAHISGRNIQSMLGASFGALVLISGILVFSLRSLKIGLISLVPNLAPAFMAFGVWGLIIGQVGLALSVVVSLTLGIIVDDTVHFLSKYLRARREEGMRPDGAVRYAFSTVGSALWVTSVALVAGFLMLTLSGYRMTSDLGLMAAITISLALALDFLLLPTLLMKVESRAGGDNERPLG